MTDSFNQDFEELVKILQSSPYRALRQSATRRLGNFGERAIQPLTEAIQNNDNDPTLDVELERALKRVTDKK